MKDKPKILIVRKLSALEYYYDGNHKSEDLNKGHKNHNETVCKIEELVKKAGYNPLVVTRKELSEQLINGYDYVISAGGDGTVIATAAFNKYIPQLNLKTDEKSKGKLCSHLSIEEAINNLIKENYETENWTRQDVFLNGKLIGRALNETAIGEDMNFTKMTRYNLKLNDKKDYNENSGLIIVTGTGSTGWPNAFKPFPRNSKSLKFLTILPCEGREIGKGNYFKIEYKGHEGKVAIDTVRYDFPRDSMLEIKVSPYPLKIII